MFNDLRAVPVMRFWDEGADGQGLMVVMESANSDLAGARHDDPGSRTERL